mmetsp:Transcript_27852/g.66332  ORF Transcript_27852/g.66332 Transcript_27852/m.66332 type:complete len:296 (-) Transcript_27852:142-1029(-)|eukprot:CAMPEP_0180143162 /NCGR_PEP_ID=MMETSP0986-20121125/16089_1 /TAXON_ID=697907 /ORGANISM="non described non described, Strain CCMP2293" /LENGTH=295 /DNA_ID=CAMNT_0022086653 /DNA_START=71 /DNA_END=958 /DNA_ORIENTATION=-
MTPLMIRAPLAVLTLALVSNSLSVSATVAWKSSLPLAATPARCSALCGANQLRLRGGKKAVEITDEYSEFLPPKRAMSAYMYFANHVRPIIGKAKPELTMTGISKEIGIKWKDLAEPDRKKFHTESENAKVTYEKEKSEYEAKVPEDIRKQRLSKAQMKKRKILKKKSKDPNAPKKALSAFMIFSNKIREQVKTEKPELGFAELGREIANRWNVKTPEQKKEFEAISEEAKAKYLIVKAKYDLENPPAEKEEPVKKEKPAKKPKVAKDGEKKEGVKKESKKEPSSEKPKKAAPKA